MITELVAVPELADVGPEVLAGHAVERALKPRLEVVDDIPRPTGGSVDPRIFHEDEVELARAQRAFNGAVEARHPEVSLLECVEQLAAAPRHENAVISTSIDVRADNGAWKLGAGCVDALVQGSELVVVHEHGVADLVEQQPRALVGAETELLLKLQGGDGLLAMGHHPDCVEPVAERKARAVKGSP